MILKRNNNKKISFPQLTTYYRKAVKALTMISRIRTCGQIATMITTVSLIIILDREQIHMFFSLLLIKDKIKLRNIRRKLTLIKKLETASIAF
jgi:hypothetical protein